MNEAFVFIGSNIEPAMNYPVAVERLRTLGKILAVSPVYETPALGANNAPNFYNGAVLLGTDFAPHALRQALRGIERDMGRVRTADKYAPRPIDLDLVLYGEVALDDGELKIPDPDIFERPFMAHALAQLEPDYVIPPDGPTLAELACRLRVKRSEMVEQVELSQTLQQWVEPKSFVKRGSMTRDNIVNSSELNNIGWHDHSEGTASDDAHTLPGPLSPDNTAAHRDIADAVRSILVNVGEDPTREGLLKTPERVAHAYDELLEGYRLDPVTVANGAFFETAYHDMVVVQDIEFYSLCEHHLLPFFGRVQVAYIPDGQVIGLSKIPRLVNMYARRLQLQERMTHEIADALQELLHPRGIAVIVTGHHMCSMMRGVKQASSTMLTQVMTGDFQNSDIRAQLNDRLRQEV